MKLNVINESESEFDVNINLDKENDLNKINNQNSNRK